LKHPTDNELRTADQRDALVRQALQLMETMSQGDAAAQLGVPAPTLCRWLRKYRAEGFAGLAPKRSGKVGRISAAQRLEITDDERACILACAMDMQSASGALRAWALSGRCRAEVAEVILGNKSKHTIPRSLLELARVDEFLAAAHRGPKRLGLRIWTPRTQDILPGDVFCADDTTPIFGWWVPWPVTPETPFGRKMVQGQMLPVIDVASQAVLMAGLIAREKGSYRATDIWALMGRVMEEVGIPRLGWQLERGSWEAQLIAGAEIREKAVNGKGEPDPGRDHKRILGGLRMLPTNALPWHTERLDGAEFPKTLQTWTSFSPKSKSVEAWFDRSQTLEGCLWGSLGRSQMRNPFEAAKRNFQRCQACTEDPALHFLSHTELLVKLLEIWRYLNADPMEGRVFKGAPDQVFARGMEEHGGLASLPPEQRWLFRRDWARVKVARGMVIVNRGDRTVFYTNAEKFPLMNGQQVLCYWDSEDPEQPAQIVRLNNGTPEWVCEARHFDPPGAFLDVRRHGHDERKAQKETVMRAYAKVVQHAPSRQLPAGIVDARAQSEIDRALREHREAAVRKAEQAEQAEREQEREAPAPARGRARKENFSRGRDDAAGLFGNPTNTSQIPARRRGLMALIGK
jgi:hypothetical protein